MPATKICTKCRAEITGDYSSCPYDGWALQDLPKDDLIGTVFASRYEILSILGKGGMSTVYKARHQLMNRTVAIKLLHTHLVSDDIAVERFKQEAQAASSLSHPNVITVYDFGITEDQKAYLVMDCLEGPTLADVLEKEGQIPLNRALVIFRQICDGLDHAHRKGIVHRDLKPSNLCLGKEEDGTEVVKIVDFGIAKLLPEEGKKRQQLTQTGQIFGSPLFMSPEQCQGKPLDARSDIYSLGCLMYESLAGVPPLMGDTAFDTMNMHVYQKPADLRTSAPNIDVPEEVEALVMKALEKSPERRYQTARELRQDLPEPEVALSATGRRHKWRPSKLPLALVVSGALSTAILVAFLWLLCAPGLDSGTPFPGMRADIQVFLAERAKEVGAFNTSAALFDRAEEAASNLSDHYRRQLDILERKRQMYQTAHNRDGEQACSDKISAVKDSHGSQLYQEESAEIKELESGAQIYQAESSDPAKAEMDKAELTRRILARGKRTSEIASELWGLGLKKEAVTVVERARKLDSAILGTHHLRVAELSLLLANFYNSETSLASENAAEADNKIRSLYQLAFQSFRDQLHDNNLQTVEALLDLGSFDRNWNRFAQAGEELQLAKRWAEEILMADQQNSKNANLNAKLNAEADLLERCQSNLMLLDHMQKTAQSHIPNTPSKQSSR